jgi:hypothetical protein
MASEAPGLAPGVPDHDNWQAAERPMGHCNDCMIASVKVSVRHRHEAIGVRRKKGVADAQTE